MIYIDILTVTLSRDSIEVRTPVFSGEGLALCDLPSPTDILSPIDYRTARRSTTGLRLKETPSLNGRLNDQNGSYPPSGSPVIGARPPPSPSGYSVNSVSSAYSREKKILISQILGSWNEEEEPRYSGHQFGSPKREREPRPISLVLRPTSSGGPTLQVLSPPPVRVSLAARRGTTLPSPLPPVPAPRRQSRRPITPSHRLRESASNVSESRNSGSLTPEEGLIQLQMRAQRADNDMPLRYRRSFRHVRGLTPRTLPTASRLLQLSITAAPVNAHLDNLEDDAIRSDSEESQIESTSASSLDGLEPLSTPPDDAVPGITITRSIKGSSATSKHASPSICVREDKDANSFLDFEPGTPLSPPSPAVQSPFSVAQSQLFIHNNIYAHDSDDGPAEQSYAGPSTNNHKKQRDRGAKRRASPISPPAIDDLHGSMTKLGTLNPGAGARQSVYSNGGRTRGSGTSGARGTRAVGKSHRRRSSGVVRRSHRPTSRSGSNVTRKSGNWGPSGTISVIGGVGLRPGIGSKIMDKGLSRSRVHDDYRTIDASCEPPTRQSIYEVEN